MDARCAGVGFGVTAKPFPPGRPSRCCRVPQSARISAEAAQAIIEALGYDGQRPPEQQREKVTWAFLFAIETAMRCGEICKLTPEDVQGTYRPFARHQE